MGSYSVVVGAGSLRSSLDDVAVFPHRWTPEDVTVECEFTGAHLLHLAVAGCVLNDVFREASSLAITVDGVRVKAEGDFDTLEWTSTGITYVVEVDSSASESEIAMLLDRVDGVSEIPKTVRAGARVERVRR